jgi:hypothetical protein
MKRALFLLLVAACVDKGPGPQPKKIEPAYVAANLIQEIPTTAQRVDVDLGGKVVYVGNIVQQSALAPGQPVRITHYWQVKAPPGPGWRMFSILRGAPGSADYMNLPATDMELGHSPETWKAGEIIQDVQDFTLRPDWKSPSATLLVGLIRDDGHGVGDRMAASGPNVIDRAVVARTLPVDLSKAPPPQGTVYIPHAAAPIAIDGVANEGGWAGAVASPEFQTAEGCPEPGGKASAKLTWDEDNLYVFVSVTDTDVVSEYTKHDDSLWKADDIEVFIDADGNRRGYVELQVNPNNATFDSWFASTRAQPGDPTWDSNMQTGVRVRGTPAAGDSDQGWDAEIAIPWAAVKGRDDKMGVRIPPQVGDRWHLNVNRVDRASTGQGTSVQTWNRITCGDWHATDRMLTAVFADHTGSIVPKPPAPAGEGSGAGSGSAAGSGAGSGSASAMRATGSASLMRAAGSAAAMPPATQVIQSHR